MVNIHNIMEEQVIEHVNRLYDQVKDGNSPWLTCDCENCRLDTICYVLNRVPPKYVAGGRGVTHNSRILHDSQLSADLDKLCIEGMRIVNTAKRPYHKESRRNPLLGSQADRAEFNFPSFIGNVYDGNTFEPVAGASVHLLLDDQTAEMMDVTWPNPCQTFEATSGSYSFWISSIAAVSEGMNKKFNITVEVSAPGYVSQTYSFTVPLTSEKVDRREFNSTYSVKIQDIFLFHDE